MSQNNSSQRNFEFEPEHRDYPPLELHREEILIVVKTAPQPSVHYREIVCSAGITRQGVWVRLYPISFRYMNFLRQYSKYQWISVDVIRNLKDFRVDSYRPNIDTIKILSKPLPAEKWTERKKVVLPTISRSLEEVIKKYQSSKISLGVFKPKKILDFIIEDDDKDWSPKHKNVLAQGVLFDHQPKELEKIPYKFNYIFICNDPECNTKHKLQIIDWEIYQLYRNMKEKHPFSIDIVLEKVKNKWFHEMWGENKDSYLIVGSTYPYPSFVVLGVFWPPKN